MRIWNPKFTTIMLTIFVVFSVVGFAYPLFAYDTVPYFRGQSSGNKLVVTDQNSLYAVTDANLIEGGHMTVPTHGALLGYATYPGSNVATTSQFTFVSPQRRRVGMLVTVLDDSNTGTSTYLTTLANHVVTYRLVSIPAGGSGCPSSTAQITDQSLDGVSTSCATTQNSNWKIVLPDVSAATIGQVLGHDSSGNVVWQSPAGGSGGSSTTLVISPSCAGTSTCGSGFPASLDTTSTPGYSFLNFYQASSTQAGYLSSADYSSFISRLLPSNNLSELTSTSSARANLGLSDIVTYTATSFLSVPNLIGGVYQTGTSSAPFWEISSLGSAAQADARTNLGLGSLSTLNYINNVIWSSAGGNQLSAVNGGTGLTSYGAGDLLYANSTSTLTNLAIGPNGYVLMSNGSAPYWASLSGISINFSNANATTTCSWGGASSPCGHNFAGTDLVSFLNNVFFPAAVITWSVDHNYLVSHNFVNDTAVASAPTLAFTLNTTTGLSHPTCTASGGDLSCQKVDSSHINLSSAWTTTPGATTTTHHYSDHNLVIWREYSNGVAQSVYSTSTDSVAYNDVTCDQLTDTPCTNSSANTTSTASGGSVTTNNVGSVLVGVSNSSGSICGITTVGPSNITTTSPCNGTFSSISNSGQSATFALTFGSTSGGQATDYTVQLKDTSGATISTITRHLTFVSVAPSYWFASCFNYTNNTDCTGSGPFYDTTDGASVSKSSSQIAADFVALTSTCESGTTGCGTTTQTSHNKNITVGGLSHQHIYYAYPVTGAGGAISGTINDTSGSTLTPDTSWFQSTVSLTNTTGYTEPYYLYSYLFDGSVLEKTSGTWQVAFPN